MWYGKLAIIMYIFNLSILFGGYYIGPIFGFTSFNDVTYTSLDALANNNNINQSINTDLVFGDFIAGVTLVFNILTFGGVSSGLHHIPYVSEAIMLLVRILFTGASAFLWVFIVANRSL